MVTEGPGHIGDGAMIVKEMYPPPVILVPDRIHHLLNKQDLLRSNHVRRT